MSQPPEESRSWPDLAGRLIEGRRHVLPVRVYFEDTDFSGLVYHATYLRWCERGRSDFLRLMGNDHQARIAGAQGRECSARLLRCDSSPHVRVHGGGDVMDEPGVPLLVRLQVCG